MKSETNTESTVGSDCQERLVRMYDCLRVETHNGNRIVCGGILPVCEIHEGQRWMGSTGHVVEITLVRPITDEMGEVIDHEVYYEWRDSSGEKSHSKLAFAFQCRYCLILPNDQAQATLPRNQQYEDQ